MEGDSDKNLSSEQLNDSGVAVKPQCTKESNEIVSVDEKSEDIQKMREKMLWTHRMEEKKLVKSKKLDLERPSVQSISYMLIL